MIEEMKKLKKEGSLLVKGFYGLSKNRGVLLGWSAIPETSVGDGYHVMSDVKDFQETTAKYPHSLKQQAAALRLIKIEASAATLIAIVGLIIGAVAMMRWLPVFMIGIGAAIIFSVFAALALSDRIEEVKRAQWHAAEHKVIFLLDRDIPLTLEEAKKAFSVSEGCGVGNACLAEPTESQLRAVLEVGEKLRKRVEEVKKEHSSAQSFFQLNC